LPGIIHHPYTICTDGRWMARSEFQGPPPPLVVGTCFLEIEKNCGLARPMRITELSGPALRRQWRTCGIRRKWSCADRKAVEGRQDLHGWLHVTEIDLRL